jgi:DNA helicase IV
MSVDKTTEYAAAVGHVGETRDAIAAEIGVTGAQVEKFQRSGSAPDEAVRSRLLAHFSDRLDQLHHLFPSPYFVRCDVRGADGRENVYYFSKFPFTERSIFSWLSPAARLRFADVGPAAYQLPDGALWHGEVTRKDQFMVVGGRIAFMTTESEAYGRTLVHQEELSRRKPGFLLPEIVAKMERAQDDVIRARPDGSFLIAGPAGSGKTTLAFHRIAYLLQSPDTADRFSPRDVIVFVQDEGTRAYFSKLLPDLGIHDVRVATFGEWALERLGFAGVATVVRRANGVDETVDAYEARKREALRSPGGTWRPRTDAFAALRAAYAPYFSDADKDRLSVQEEARELDRFDLTLLLRFARERDGAFRREEEYLVQKKNFEVTRRRRSVPLRYSLMVVDEAQNYLSEQIALLRTCVSPDTRAMLYVGDLGQQVLVGTVRDWSDAGEDFSGGRRVELEKVYRNTAAILRYLGSLGFETAVPEGLREGEPVAEETCTDADEELVRVRGVVEAKHADEHVGVVSPSSARLEPFRAAFAGRADVHVLTVHEAQGVEFDAVCLVGVESDFFRADGERLKIKRDLLYVALTRAMERLYVFGPARLRDIV